MLRILDHPAGVDSGPDPIKAKDPDSVRGKDPDSQNLPILSSVLLDGLTVGHPAGIALLTLQRSHPHLEQGQRLISAQAILFN